ncbi:hypothetical protein HNP00_003001 [Arthrobacter sp. AZCC_0090]|nr:hypothetical protein [Arthrobacter sp. AZCC_0090]MBB6405671.1 hypothetical protein [Arthrobacter sp. AZCC_0090]
MDLTSSNLTAINEPAENAKIVIKAVGMSIIGETCRRDPDAPIAQIAIRARFLASCAAPMLLLSAPKQAQGAVSPLPNARPIPIVNAPSRAAAKNSAVDLNGVNWLAMIANSVVSTALATRRPNGVNFEGINRTVAATKVSNPAFDSLPIAAIENTVAIIVPPATPIRSIGYLLALHIKRTKF